MDCLGLAIPAAAAVVAIPTQRHLSMVAMAASPVAVAAEVAQPRTETLPQLEEPEREAKSGLFPTARLDVISNNEMASIGNGPPLAPGRSCGKCSLCCKLLHVVELQKPANKWCKHCRPGYGGCSIYETRPQICRGYACGWLMSDKVSEEWFPLHSHMVLSLGVFNSIQTVTVTVDPRFPWMWQQQPYYAQLKQMSRRGLHVTDAADILLVHVRVDDRVWLLVPNDDIEITRGSYVVKLAGPSQWEVEQFATQERAAERVAELT